MMEEWKKGPEIESYMGSTLKQISCKYFDTGTCTLFILILATPAPYRISASLQLCT